MPRKKLSPECMRRRMAEIENEYDLEFLKRQAIMSNHLNNVSYEEISTLDRNTVKHHAALYHRYMRYRRSLQKCEAEQQRMSTDSDEVVESRDSNNSNRQQNDQVLSRSGDRSNEDNGVRRLEDESQNVDQHNSVVEDRSCENC